MGEQSRRNAVTERAVPARCHSEPVPDYRSFRARPLSCRGNLSRQENIDSFNRRLGKPCLGTPEQKQEKKRDWRCVRTERYKLIEFFSPEECVLYDLKKDPLETDDLAAEMPELVRQLQSAMPLREHA